MNPRILIVDDEASVRLALVRWFGIRGFEVSQAADGLEAVECVEQHHAFDVVLMDLEMPRMHGLEAMARMRKHSADLPIIILSGYARDKAKAWDQGAALVLSKPIRLAVLEQHVREVLAEANPGTPGRSSEATSP